MYEYATDLARGRTLAGWNDPRTLVIAIGNEGRQDDGLGWALADRLAKADWFSGKLIYRYQLQIEDAATLCDFQRVIFADASRAELSGGFECTLITGLPGASFSTHNLDPSAVLYLSRTLYQQEPTAVQLAVRGYTWDLAMGLSAGARQNLEATIGWLKKQWTSPPMGS